MLIAVLAIFPTAAITRSQAVIIQNDRGGGVAGRAVLIEKYQAGGIHVEIRGNYCMSTCTMYLALANTCVLPNTTFGFHGPSSQLYGISLSPAGFEHWSRVMADHYPQPLRDWYLEKGRHRTVGFYNFSGQELIKIGIARCTG